MKMGVLCFWGWEALNLCGEGDGVRSWLFEVKCAFLGRWGVDLCLYEARVVVSPFSTCPQ